MQCVNIGSKCRGKQVDKNCFVRGDNLGYYTGPNTQIRGAYVSHCVIIRVTSRRLLFSEQVATMERQGMHT